MQCRISCAIPKSTTLLSSVAMRRHVVVRTCATVWGLLRRVAKRAGTIVPQDTFFSLEGTLQSASRCRSSSIHNERACLQPGLL